ncbi:hypothetical protein DFH07DRAFT_733251, partial [Mycena maculata]
KENSGKTRLHRIIVSESVFLIWCLHNTRVIGGKGEPSEREIRNCWVKIMNNRITLDCVLTDTLGPRGLKKIVICKTWAKVLRDEDRLPEDWMRETRVLVSVG